jgi:hypothetical protein
MAAYLTLGFLALAMVLCWLILQSPGQAVQEVAMRRMLMLGLVSDMLPTSGVEHAIADLGGCLA